MADISLTMRVTQWLRRPAAEFIHPAGGRHRAELLAAERGTVDDAKELRAIAQAGMKPADDAAWRSASRDFHNKILSMSGNSLLDLVAGAMKEIYEDRVSDFPYHRRQQDLYTESHLEIAEAILAGDGETAGRLMHEHMTVFLNAVIKRDAKLLDEVVDWR